MSHGNQRIIARIGRAFITIGVVFTALGSVGLYSVARYAMLPSSYANTDLSLITTGLIYLVQGLLMIKDVRNKNYAVLSLLITAITIGAPTGIVIGTMDFISFEVVIVLIVVILTIPSIYALIRMMIDYGLGAMAMLGIGLITASLGMPPVLT